MEFQELDLMDDTVFLDAATSIQPTAITLRGVGFFEKSEIEESATKLVTFFESTGGTWRSFTFKELAEFYDRMGWKQESMLYGLIGHWWHDGDGMLHQAPPYIVQNYISMHVTGLFLKHCFRPRPTPVARV